MTVKDFLYYRTKVLSIGFKLTLPSGDDPVDPGDPVVEEVRDPPLVDEWRHIDLEALQAV